jgi:hypothetical protein
MGFLVVFAMGCLACYIFLASYERERFPLTEKSEQNDRANKLSLPMRTATTESVSWCGRMKS